MREGYRETIYCGVSISLFFLYFFLKGEFFGGNLYYEEATLLLGRYYIVLIALPLMVTAYYLKDSGIKKVAFIIRSISLLLLLCSINILVLTKILNGVVIEGQREFFLNLALEKLNLGSVLTWGYYNLYFSLEKVILVRGATSVVIVSSIIVFFKGIKGLISEVKESLEFKREKKRLLDKERELVEKINIKEMESKRNIEKLRKREVYIEENIKKKVQEYIEAKEDKEEEDDSSIEIT